VKLLHIAKQCFIVRRGNEARLSPYEAIMEIMKRRLRGMKRSLTASCFFAIGKKMAE